MCVTPHNVEAVLDDVDESLQRLETAVAKLSQESPSTSTSKSFMRSQSPPSSKSHTVSSSDSGSSASSISERPFDMSHLPQGAPFASGVFDMNASLNNGYFALTLLPEDACPALVVITSGVCVLPDCTKYDHRLMLLNREDVPLSIVQLGSQCKPESGFGFAPDSGMLVFPSPLLDVVILFLLFSLRSFRPRLIAPLLLFEQPLYDSLPLKDSGVTGRPLICRRWALGCIGFRSQNALAFKTQ